MNFLKKYFAWGKKHSFHFIASLALVILFIVFSVQQTMLHHLKTRLNEIPNSITKSEDGIKELIKEENSAMRETIELSYDVLHARVDTVDSAIKPEKKRRELVSKIRNAITENTNRTINIRDLNRIANAVIDYSYEYNFTISQILAQMKTESDFNVKATSSAGAQGLMQIMPATLNYIQYEMSNGLLNLTHGIYIII